MPWQWHDTTQHDTGASLITSHQTCSLKDSQCSNLYYLCQTPTIWTIRYISQNKTPNISLLHLHGNLVGVCPLNIFIALLLMVDKSCYLSQTDTLYLHYKTVSVHPSVRPSIRPSVRPSVRPSIRPSVRPFTWSSGPMRMVCRVELFLNLILGREHGWLKISKANCCPAVLCYSANDTWNKTVRQTMRYSPGPGTWRSHTHCAGAARTATGTRSGTPGWSLPWAPTPTPAGTSGRGTCCNRTVQLHDWHRTTTWSLFVLSKAGSWDPTRLKTPSS